MFSPWILCFDLLPLKNTNLTHQIWRFLVYIFLAPTEVEGKGLKFWCDITFQQKTSQYIKLERIVMIFGFLVNMENTKQYILIPPLRPFSLKNDGLPLNSLFWFSPTAVHRFDASYMAVPGLHISCTRLQELISCSQTQTF